MRAIVGFLLWRERKFQFHFAILWVRLCGFFQMFDTTTMEKKKIFFTNSSPLQAGAFFHCQKIFFIIQFKPVNSSRGTLKNALSASARRRFHYICQECYFCYQLWHNRVGNAIDNRWKKMKILFHLWLQPLSSSSSLLLFPFVRLQTWLRIGIKRRTDKKKDEKTLCEEIHN